MKNRIRSLSFMAALAFAFGMVSWSSALQGQTTPSTGGQQATTQSQQASPNTTPTDQTPQTQQPPAQAPETPSATQEPPTSKMPDQSQTPPSNAAPDSSSASSTPSATGVQAFTGTVVKSGDKYMLKDESGQTYDIDHQSEVAKFEGKRIRVHGILDANGAIQLK